MPCEPTTPSRERTHTPACPHPQQSGAVSRLHKMLGEEVGSTCRWVALYFWSLCFGDVAWPQGYIIANRADTDL